MTVTPSPTGITLVATRGFAAGEQRKLTIYFADGREPGSVTFILVGQSTGKPRQVNVLRRIRTAASLRQEAQEQRQRAEVCEQQLAQCGKQATSTTLLERLLRLGKTDGLTLQWRKVNPPVGQRGDLKVVDLSTTRMKVEEGQREAAVRIQLRNDGKETWTVEGASLAAGGGQALPDVRVLSDASLAAGDSRGVYVVLGPTQQELRGNYTLKLWGGGRELIMEDIFFP